MVDYKNGYKLLPSLNPHPFNEIVQNLQSSIAVCCPKFWIFVAIWLGLVKKTFTNLVQANLEQFVLWGSLFCCTLKLWDHNVQSSVYLPEDERPFGTQTTHLSLAVSLSHTRFEGYYILYIMDWEHWKFHSIFSKSILTKEIIYSLRKFSVFFSLNF